jgi:predicted MFS family arabinose efflux permease
VLFAAGCYDYADDVLHASPSARLGLSALWGLVYIIGALLGGRISERLGSRRLVGVMVCFTIIASMVGLISIAIPKISVVLLIMLPFNVSNTMIWPALASAISRTRARTRLSARTAFCNLSWGSSGFAALFVCGALEKL